ncbi:hypothetical protein SEA_LOZINAK_124 [Gordonia phage Lozinak]|uniref:Uncharacterized protein n=3 Tax=Smoothievirus TaxID=1982557 RepID=A0A2D1GGA0_9CAUD|nr:hypothetical protein BEN60_gp082 [Gordonia phage Smoothie]YP_009273159.1 hypothetical protein BH768_gp083 [Gordonia phage ClubL]ANA86281.1 hypothetical protein PBI_SMOOTHIE_125 [Gordonia phage Smoothie]ANA86622.1 hypothetical protein PBI_CLUBL_124 [Gordonia phage ClubL]ATN90750.1 hypothetical protein SEA_LOZINAK_124 [Gordonia phage Lozinak]
MFAKFEVHEESETVEVTGAAAVGKFRDGYFVTENLVYRRITVSVWFNSEPDQVRLTEVETLDAGDEPEIVLDSRVVKTLERDSDIVQWGQAEDRIHYLEASGRLAPQSGWTKVPADLIIPAIRDLKV